MLKVYRYDELAAGIRYDAITGKTLHCLDINKTTELLE
jgi:hypothetical protein